jgi:hypothetical protein
MKSRIASCLAIFAFVLGGCASHPQMPIEMPQGTLSGNGSRIGVAMTPIPKIDTQLPGAGCLLCYAAAALANSSLTSYAHTLPADDLIKLKTEIVEIIRKQGGDAVAINEDIKLDALPDSSKKGDNIPKKDFSALRKKYNVDRLVVINVTGVGFVRTYSSYVPTSDPKGMIQGEGYLVNLESNTYDWYEPLNITKSADGAWDEPPKFPGLTNAYFQVVELGRDALMQAFLPKLPAQAPDAPVASTDSLLQSSSEK